MKSNPAAVDGRTLTDADLSALARLLEERSRTRLVSAKTLGRLLELDAEWVRDHATELGVIRVGDGPRPRLRFDPDVAVEALRDRAARPRHRRTRPVIEPVVQARRPRR